MRRPSHFLLTLLAGIFLAAGLFAPVPAALDGSTAGADAAPSACSGDAARDPAGLLGSNALADPDGPFSRDARPGAKPFLAGASPDAASALDADAFLAAASPPSAAAPARYAPRLSTRSLYLTTLRLRI